MTPDRIEALEDDVQAQIDAIADRHREAPPRMIRYGCDEAVRKVCVDNPDFDSAVVRRVFFEQVAMTLVDQTLPKPQRLWLMKVFRFGV